VSATVRSDAPRILLIEDDRGIAVGIVRGLKAAGFSVELANSGMRGAELGLFGKFSLIVLDLMLPEIDGYEILDRWRGHSLPPIIVLSARTELDTRLRVFGSGAIDNVSKPFWVEELVARIRARLSLPQLPAPRRIYWDDSVLDHDARTLTVSGAAISLTGAEFSILTFLVERSGRAVSRGQLAEAALPVDGDRFDRTVDSHVARIRRKLGPSGAARIVTVWGIGYRFDAPEQP
jgi:DNA-binding response OmpR family regulator